MTTEPIMRTSPHASKTSASIAGHGMGMGNTGTIRRSRDGVRSGQSGSGADLISGVMGDLEMSFMLRLNRGDIRNDDS